MIRTTPSASILDFKTVCMNPNVIRLFSWLDSLEVCKISLLSFYLRSFILSVAKTPNTLYLLLIVHRQLGHVSGFLQAATGQTVMCSGRSAFTQETKHDFINHVQY